MKEGQAQILTINSGSSSIKFSLYQHNETLEKVLSGKIERIGTEAASFVYSKNEQAATRNPVTAKDISAAALFLITWLEKEISLKHLTAIAHRIVYGMHHTAPLIITPQILAELKQFSVFDPDHMPGAIVLIEKLGKKYPSLKQIACFDTAFHAGIPRVASMFPLPRRFEKDGIRRYGFHGISYNYLLEKLEVLAGKNISQGRLVLAHLGSGSSMAAVKNGRCIDTTMGFTPAGGLMMSTRSGDLDPGIITYLLRKYKYTSKQLDRLINQESGLLGVSAISADMHDLLDKEHTDISAAEAIALFCYQAKKSLCAFTGALGGVDAIVFTGGIGENASTIRSRICDGLKYLGIELDSAKNQENASMISLSGSPVNVYVIPANEEYMIAALTLALLNHSSTSKLK